MPTQQHPFHNHLIAHKYYTNKYLKSVSFHLQPTSKTSIHISSTHQVTSSELLTAAPYKSDTNNSNIQTPHPAQSLQVTLLSLKQTKAKLTQPFSTFIKIHHPKFKASFSKPNSVSIHKTPMTIPFDKQHFPLHYQVLSTIQPFILYPLALSHKYHHNQWTSTSKTFS